MSPDKSDGITLFLVDAKSPRLSCTLLKTFTADKQCEVVFDEVRVTKANVIGEPGKGIEGIGNWRSQKLLCISEQGRE